GRDGSIVGGAVLVGLDEDVDLVGPLVALLIGHREGRRVLTYLVVGVQWVLLGALGAVPEVPRVGPRTALFLLDRRRELHLQRRRALVRLGLRDDIELVLLVLVAALALRGRSRRGRCRLLGSHRRGRGLRLLGRPAAAASDHSDWYSGDAGEPEQ